VERGVAGTDGGGLGRAAGSGERRATENGGARNREMAAAKSPFGSATRFLAWAVTLPNGPLKSR